MPAHAERYRPREPEPSALRNVAANATKQIPHFATLAFIWAERIQKSHLKFRPGHQRVRHIFHETAGLHFIGEASDHDAQDRSASLIAEEYPVDGGGR